DGNVEILNLFWNFKLNTFNNDLVHPVLVYADLMATGDHRNIETAGMIYDAEIVRFIRED
ncbi:MAG: type IV toxin-antitoxin system AbiEi family antitoxin, partial [Desulfobacterales bacterium]